VHHRQFKCYTTTSASGGVKSRSDCLERQRMFDYHLRGEREHRRRFFIGFCKTPFRIILKLASIASKTAEAALNVSSSPRASPTRNESHYHRHPRMGGRVRRYGSPEATFSHSREIPCSSPPTANEYALCPRLALHETFHSYASREI